MITFYNTDLFIPSVDFSAVPSVIGQFVGRVSVRVEKLVSSAAQTFVGAAAEIVVSDGVYSTASGSRRSISVEQPTTLGGDLAAYAKSIDVDLEELVGRAATLFSEARPPWRDRLTDDELSDLLRDE